ncbi:MAG TPA: hypothetical protein VJK72_05295, partial [Candidatus Nanoarchaeia archaeon]|nr:hypothetical protein [Candidatus Nanoarchaeia archaeon]
MYSSNNYAPIVNYGSGLESKVAEYAISAIPQVMQYKGRLSAGGYKKDNYRAIAEEQPIFFLNPKRPMTQFIGNAFEISAFIEEAFEKTTGKKLPSDILITIAQRSELITKNLAFLKESVVGLSVIEPREIFVVSGNMDEVMLTCGHEIGHI